jgi:hypothetical protein
MNNSKNKSRTHPLGGYEGDILLTSEALEGYKVKNRNQQKNGQEALDFLNEGIYE